MEEQILRPSKKSLRQAGDILRNLESSTDDFRFAMGILSQWRQLHSYPINTFNVYFRRAIKNYPNALIAQRLKRVPSIIDKLRRFPKMNFDRMQDICGFRIILKNLSDVYALHSYFVRSKTLKHELILPPKDYIKEPKEDGYRSLHQVFKYNNKTFIALNDLRIELQLRTDLQHSWATAVETLGIVEKSSFKTGEGSEQFKEFFKLTSQLFAWAEGGKRLVDGVDYSSFLNELNFLENELQISQKLSGLALSAKHIETVSKDSKGYHLMELDLRKNHIHLVAFPGTQLEKAESLYSLEEEKKRGNPYFSVILISAGNLKQIKKAYPNYFLDTNKFISKFNQLKDELRKVSSQSK